MLQHCKGGTSSEHEVTDEAGDGTGGAAGASPLKASPQKVDGGAAAEENISNGHANGQVVTSTVKTNGVALHKHNGKWTSLFFTFCYWGGKLLFFIFI